MPIHRLVFPLFLLALLATAGCDDPVRSGTETRPESELVFLRTTPDAPPLERQTVSFVARKGENAVAEIRYVRTEQYDEGKCLEFRVPGDALLRYPDGRSFQKGDSVRITITVVDPARFIFRFEPSGLKFSPERPAEMRVSYRWADRDHNGDGVVDERDRPVEESFAVWHQEREGLPWSRIATARLKDLQEVRAELRGFSKYALAGGH